MIYLDHAATTPMRPEVWDAMAPYALEVYGNSSGVHEVSRRAKNALETAREQVAELIGARPMEIVFTSGGTESDNLALKGAAWSSTPRTGVVTVATEHEAVLETMDLLSRFDGPTTVVGVDASGLVEPEDLVHAMDSETVLVSVMLVNNETGVVQDVAEVSRQVKAADPEVLVHTDAVQAFAGHTLDVGLLGVDMMTITGHKFGGPKGAGLLYVKEGTVLEPIIHGGGQELGRRSGTHDVAGAVGLAKAMSLATEHREFYRDSVGQIRNEFEKRLIAGIAEIRVNTPEATRSANHLNVRIPAVRNENLLMRMDRAGVAASAGSACQSGAANVSHVLEAMGMSASQARESVRFSFGWTSTLDEAVEASEIVIDLVEQLR